MWLRKLTGAIVLRSMTGFGRSTGHTCIGQVSVELKGVNHRYLDLAVRMPRDLSVYEEEVKAILRDHLSRGRVELTVKLSAGSREHKGADVDIEQIARYLERLRPLAERFSLEGNVTLGQLLALPGVIIEPEPLTDSGEVVLGLRAIVLQAVSSLVESRQAEGERLRADIKSRIEAIHLWVEAINAKAGTSLGLYRQRLQENLKQILSNQTVDSQRLETEVVLFAERVSITEEIVRLRAHLGNFESMLDSTQAVGRKMDFYLQEMNREANTIGNKSQDVAISQLVVEIKSELEKIREQVQNLE